MKNIDLSVKTNKPIYLDLYDQISSSILKGDLKSGASLPSIRTAAKELRVSIITVKKAWEELEKDGLIYTVAGKGCFVTETSKEGLGKKLTELVEAQLDKDLTYYKKLDLPKEELIKLINKLY